MAIDIFVIVIFIAYIISGYKTGFFVEFISMFGLVGNILLAKMLVPKVIDLLQMDIEPSEYTKMYVTVLIILYIILMILTSIVNKFFKTQSKGFFTKIGGALVALLKGVVVAFFLVTGCKLLGKTSEKVKMVYNESITVNYLDELLPLAYDYIPMEIQEQIEELKNKEIINKYLKNIF